MELASKFLEQMKNLKVADDVAIGIARSKIDAKELQDDLPAQPAVSLKDFDDLLVAVQRSRGAFEEASKPAAAPAPARPAAGTTADEAAVLQELATLTQKLELHIERSSRRTDAMAQGDLAIGNLLGQVTKALTKISEQVAAQDARQTNAILEIQRSLQARVPSGPRAVTGRAAPAPAPGDEAPSVIEIRRSVDTALKIEIQRSQDLIRNAPTEAERINAVNGMKRLSAAAAELGAGGDPMRIATAAGLKVDIKGARAA